jgi:hypothetical protein
LAKDDTPREFQEVGTASPASSLQGISKLPIERCQAEDTEPRISGVVGNESPNENGLEMQYASASDTRPSYDPMKTEFFFTSDPPTVPREDREPHHSSMSAFPAQRERYQIGPLKGLPESCTDKSYTNLEEACLIRHFTENLALWVCLTILHFVGLVLTKNHYCSSIHVIGTDTLSFTSLNEPCSALSYGMRF